LALKEDLDLEKIKNMKSPKAFEQVISTATGTPAFVNSTQTYPNNKE
jgi:hypothetical protein